ncbi:toxin-antitoxin system YwqK family antitoxin [Ponticaulis profundi]|uniref:Toxin-antitoxin system YwqK family antitoxin n=1 Tax=Ponticaulis profundi TaxID=2665222 RepID=A0ABW1SCX7_9PROT
MTIKRSGFGDLRRVVLLALISMPLCLSGCAKATDTDKSDLIFRDGVAYPKDSAEPFTGTMIDFHPNGQLKQKSEFESGVNSGSSLVYYANGRLETEFQYINGKQDGVQKQYFPNGQLESVYRVQNGEHEGLSESFYENGSIQSRINFSNGVWNGTFEKFYENGSLEASGTFANGSTIEPYRKFNDSGNLVEILEFTEDGNGYGTFDFGDSALVAEVSNSVVTRHEYWCHKAYRLVLSDYYDEFKMRECTHEVPVYEPTGCVQIPNWRVRDFRHMASGAHYSSDLKIISLDHTCTALIESGQLSPN